jgi:alcohol dehydrogenase
MKGKIMNRFTIRYGKTVVYFGLEVVKNLENIVQRNSKVFIVTSKSAAKISGALKDVEEILQKLGIFYEIFSDVKPNPYYLIIEQTVESIRKYNPNYVIAIGGGSVIDTAKIASALALCGGNIKDYVFGGKQVCGSIPLIAINLTHGTGSEVNRYAVVTLDEPRTKFGIASEHFYPIASFEDPRYTFTLPSNQVLYTAIDAFYHSYESATGRDTSPFVLMLAEEAAKLIAKWLPIAVKDLSNLEARYWLMYASMLAGMAIDSSRAHIIHAIENVLSGINTDLPHGAGLAMLGPSAAIYIHNSVPELSYRILKYLYPSIRPVKDDAEKACKAIDVFQKLVGFNESLSTYGFNEKDSDMVANTVINVLKYSLRLAPFDISAEIIKAIFLRAL